MCLGFLSGVGALVRGGFPRARSNVETCWSAERSDQGTGATIPGTAATPALLGASRLKKFYMRLRDTCTFPIREPYTPLMPATTLKRKTAHRGRPTPEKSEPHAKRMNRTLAQQQTDYLSALQKYFTSSAAAAKAGLHMSVIRRWREEDGEFCVREEDARGDIADQLEGEAIRRAFKGVRAPVYQGGLLAGYITNYSDQLLTLMLKALRPEKFRERSEVRVTEPIIKVVAGFDPADVL